MASLTQMKRELIVERTNEAGLEVAKKFDKCRLMILLCRYIELDFYRKTHYTSH